MSKPLVSDDLWAALAPLLPPEPSRPRGGAGTSPNPTGRGKSGTKRPLMVDRRGTPLGVRLRSANRHDSLILAATLDAVHGVRHG